MLIIGENISVTATAIGNAVKERDAKPIVDLAKAQAWIEKAAEQMPEAFWVWRRKSLILADAGDKAGAIEAAKKSLTEAKRAGNQDYIKMNEDSLAEWGAE